MTAKRRETLLKIGVGTVVALFLLDRMVISPAFAGWKAQSERLTALRLKVQNGRQLTEREKSLRARWDEMQRANLAQDRSSAENDVYKSLSRWTAESRVSFTSLNPNWREHNDEGFTTFECRATAVGEQAALARLIYEIETDPLPARIEECELTARDAQGKQLALTLRFSFVRIEEQGRGAR